MESDQNDLVVIGGGMIGAAAARHATEAGLRVTVLGAPEPVAWDDSPGPFASHYDEGRITRIIDADPVWAELAVKSLARHDDLQRRTGISFHDPAGLVWIQPDETASGALADAVERGANARRVSTEWIRSEFNLVVTGADRFCIYEGAPAGHINPRLLVKAQLAAAELAGATLVAEPAVDLLRSPDGVTVTGAFGEITARNALLATGMYGAELASVDLDLRRMPRTTVRIEIEHSAPLPSLIINEVDVPDISDIYWVPPVRYPNGKMMLKIGGTYVHTEPVESSADIAAWFGTDGLSAEADALMAVVRQALPQATVLSWETVPCVVTQTPTTYPYVDWLDTNVAVAVGGNGSAAKSSDEIGRRAASLFARSLVPTCDLTNFGVQRRT